jgi:hypothetical protein
VAAHIRTADAAADDSMGEGQVVVVVEDSCTAECQPSRGRGRLDRDVATHLDCEERRSDGQCTEAGLLSCSFARSLIGKGALIEVLMIKMQRDEERLGKEKWLERSNVPAILARWITRASDSRNAC